MGGNIFKNTRRVDKRELDGILVYLREFVFDDTTEYYPIDFFHEKNDFGDLDILVKKRTDKDLVEKYRDYLEHLSKSNMFPDFKGVFKNQSIISFNCMDFQIDLIFMKPKWWELAKVFYSYNDLGNLMGKVARFFHLKYGFQGLRYNAYSANYDEKLFEVVLTRDPRTIFEFLGFDYDRYLKGFNNKQEIFEFVVNSKYFSKNIYEPEQLTADQRQRDVKRDTYKEFMDYIHSRDDLREYQEEPSREEIIKIIDQRDDFDKYPYNSLQEGIDAEEEIMQRKQEAKAKFNGNVVMEHFNLQGKQLGKAIGHFYNQFETDWGYYQYLLNTSQEKIFHNFEKICKQYGIL